MNGTLDLIAARCAIPARSITSCTLPDDSIAKPVCLQFITSEWSPKIENACVPTVLDATCRTPGCLCPEILCIVGIISISPCDDVNEVAKLPASSAPCTAPAAPASDCISTNFTGWPNRFSLPLADHSSVFSAIGEDGVIG